MGTLDKYEYSAKEQNFVFEFRRGSRTYFSKSSNHRHVLEHDDVYNLIQMCIWFIDQYRTELKFGDRSIIDFVLKSRSYVS